MPKRILQGTVVSDKGDKTVVVSVTRRFIHKIYKKFITSKKKYMAHDPQNLFKLGEKVEIIEHKPLSRNKKWHVVYKQENKAGAK